VLLCNCCQPGDAQTTLKHNGIPFQKSLRLSQRRLQRRRLPASLQAGRRRLRPLRTAGSPAPRRLRSLGLQPRRPVQAIPLRLRAHPEDITQELGDFEPREGRGGPGTVDIKFFIAAPVYNFDAGTVQVLSLTQKSIIKELDQISQLDDYDDLLAWDFNLSKKGSGLLTEYTLRPVPRKKGSQEHIDAAWIEAKSAGFDISRLLHRRQPLQGCLTGGFHSLGHRTAR
jgi:hypothetical protein